MHRAAVFAVDGFVRQHPHAHMAAAHFQHLGLPLALAGLPGEQGEDGARLQAQHLDVAGSPGGQVERGLGLNGQGAVEAGHIEKRSFCRSYLLDFRLFYG